jgi:peptidoglycan/LPS O-acetylase OafA/YrhL
VIIKQAGIIDEKRRANLDGLRALAVFLVLLHHTRLSMSDSFVLFPVMETGWNGILLFFVLSGFLIGSVLMSEIKHTGRLSMRRFWGRRILRTWPVYFILLGFHAWRSHADWNSLWPFLVFTQNFYGVPFYVNTWSLAAQEQFYLVIPIFLWVLASIINIKSIVWTIFLAGSALVGIIAIYADDSIWRIGALAPLSAGVLIAHAEQTNSAILNRLRGIPNILMICALLICYLPFLVLPEGPLLYVLQTIGFSLLVIAALSDRLRVGFFLNSSLAIWAAQVSYSTYLFQDRPLYRVRVFVDSLPIAGTARELTILLLSLTVPFLCGAILYYFFERPFMKMRNRLFPRTSKKIASGTG